MQRYVIRNNNDNVFTSTSANRTSRRLKMTTVMCLSLTKQNDVLVLDNIPPQPVCRSSLPSFHKESKVEHSTIFGVIVAKVE